VTTWSKRTSISIRLSEFARRIMRSGAALSDSVSDSENFAAVVVTASGAQHVRTLEFTAVRAFVEGFSLQSVVAAAHAATGRRGLSLGDGHFGTCS